MNGDGTDDESAPAPETQRPVTDAPAAVTLGSARRRRMKLPDARMRYLRNSNSDSPWTFMNACCEACSTVAFRLRRVAASA